MSDDPKAFVVWQGQSYSTNGRTSGPFYRVVMVPDEEFGDLRWEPKVERLSAALMGEPTWIYVGKDEHTRAVDSALMSLAAARIQTKPEANSVVHLNEVMLRALREIDRIVEAVSPEHAAESFFAIAAAVADGLAGVRDATSADSGGG